MTNEDRTAVYRLRDSNSRLLYIGMTGNIDQRWTQHAATKAWWPQVVRRDVEWFASREIAAAAEAEALATERPLYNIDGIHGALSDNDGHVIQAGPVYIRIAAFIRSRIESGEYAPGQRIPSETELMELYGVARGTARNALGLLASEGLTRARRGAGVFVVPTGERPPLEAPHDQIDLSRADAEAICAALMAATSREVLVDLTQRLVAALAASA